ncbi:MAG: Alcohol dehydrogenase, zinc-binding domain protein [Candidatus Solibacter sp.]|nr:Alcohol dehydrogenase, zinc-binding domain protein [Candidatus Solibacter sp.]
MKALRVSGDTLVEDNAPTPQPGTCELLIRVRAAGVTPTELIWYPTSHRKTGEPRAAAIPAHEFSGVVEAIGAEVGRLEIGHEVYGMNDWFADGAMAEYCIADFSCVAPKPPSLTHAEAAAVPIGALTAWQGLFDRARLQPGERVLVHGGAGAVGLFAVQLAAMHGAHVIATASSHNLDFVATLGASQVVDYHALPFEKIVESVDVVFDTVGGDTLARSWSLLKPGGRMVTIAAGQETSDAPTKNAFFIVEPNQKQLSIVGDLLESKRLRAVVDTVLPLADAPRAFTGAIPRRGRGKLVVAL